MNPLDSKDDFSDKHQFKEDRFNLYFDQAELINVNWWQLLTGDGIHLKKAKLSHGYIEIYNDARLPNKGISKVGKYPHQLIASAGSPIHVDKLVLTNVDVSYEEFNPVSDTSGRIDFKSTSGTISNITNVPDIIATNP